MKCPSVILLLFVFFSQCIVHSWQVQIRCPILRLNNGKVRLRARGRIVRFNCLDGFTLVGNKYSSCMRGQWDAPTPVCVNAECSLPPTPAHALVASKLNGAILLYFCEPGYALIGTAEIYCDGRNWNGTIPSCRDTTVAAPTSCDFESDLCWWEQDPQHDFDWRRHNFETPSFHIGTGPTYDHTLGAGNDGHYLYIEASGRLVNDTARIVSPLYNSSLTNSGCFSFWYHMYGATIGILNIYVKQEADSVLRSMFTKMGNQGNQWLHGIFDLPKSNSSFQIIIEGIRGGSYVSDIAIDDIAILHENECSVKNESTNVTVSNKDQIEIVNAQLSCNGRCTTMKSASRPTNQLILDPDCFCTSDCIDYSACCADYEEFCGFEVTGYTDEFTITSEGNETGTTLGTTKSPAKTNAPIRNYTKPGFPIKSKDDIDPGILNPATTTTRKPIVITKTTMKTVTKKPLIKTTTPIETTFRVDAKETPFSPLTTKDIELQDQSDQQNVGNPEKVKHEDGGVGVLEITVAICSTLVLALALVITIVVIRRRKTYDRGTNGSALSDDSDVRFLTSDEILDFNLARPSDNDDL